MHWAACAFALHAPMQLAASCLGCRPICALAATKGYHA